LRFGKPIEKTLVFEIDVLTCDCKDEDIISCFGSLSSEGYSKDTLTELLNEKQISSKYAIAAVLRTDRMVEAIRKEVRRLSGIRLESEYLSSLLESEIVKRELIDSEEAGAAATYVKKLQKAAAREKVDDASKTADGPTASLATEASSAA